MADTHRDEFARSLPEAYAYIRTLVGSKADGSPFSSGTTMGSLIWAMLSPLVLEEEAPSMVLSGVPRKFGNVRVF